jgi:recombinational DNA repair ATPase RecF
MKITRLQVKSFEGLEQLDLEPGNTNMIVGANGTGKTSVLDAIRVMFSNRSPRNKLVHDNEDRGIILFELDTGLHGVREVDDKGYTAGKITLTDSDGTSVSSAQKFLDGLGAGFGFNPLDFTELSATKQTQQLLEITPVECSVGQLISAGGKKFVGVDYNKHPLKVLKEIESVLMEERREVGREKRTAEDNAEDLRMEIPVGFSPKEARSFDLQEAYEELQDIQDKKHQQERASDKVDHLQNKVARLERELAEAKEQLATAKDNLEEATVAVETIPEGRAKEIHNRIAEYKETQKHLNTLERIEEAKKRVSTLSTDYTGLSNRIEEVRALPGELLSSTELPVSGLGINDDGEVTINGLPISELSTGEQLDIAVDIAIETLGDLKVVLVDGLERLDTTRQDRVLSRLSEAGIQAFVAKVSDDDELTIITDYTPGDVLDDGDVEVSDDDIPF